MRQSLLPKKRKFTVKREIITKVQINNAGELFLAVESGGKHMYHYIYREATGVRWDTENQGFKTQPIHGKPHSQWFNQIVDVVKSSLGVELQLSPKASWRFISETDKAEIVKQHAVYVTM